jgi:hypothetical protein
MSQKVTPAAPPPVTLRLDKIKLIPTISLYKKPQGTP